MKPDSGWFATRIPTGPTLELSFAATPTDTSSFSARTQTEIRTKIHKMSIFCRVVGSADTGASIGRSSTTGLGRWHPPNP